MAGPPPPWQFACAAYTPLLTANLSVIGSSLILLSVLSTNRDKRKPHHRILGAMSTYDLIYSLAKAWTFLLAPKGYGVPGAQGNMNTCRLQGFCIELAHATGAYNAALSTYYWLTICRGVKTETFARRIEPFMHAAISAIFWGFAIAGVVIELFNPAFGFCYIASYPPGCGGPDGPPCDRWDPKTLGFMYEMFAQMWVQMYFVIVGLTNAAIWWKVHQQEKAMQKYSTCLSADLASVSPTVAADIRRKKKKSQQARFVAVQSALYVGAFTSCWIGPTMFHLADWVGGYKAFWAVMVIVIFTPLQGFWNVIIFTRPTYLRVRRKNQNWTRLQCTKVALFGITHGETLFSNLQTRFKSSGIISTFCNEGKGQSDVDQFSAEKEAEDQTSDSNLQTQRDTSATRMKDDVDNSIGVNDDDSLWSDNEELDNIYVNGTRIRIIKA